MFVISSLQTNEVTALKYFVRSYTYYSYCLKYVDFIVVSISLQFLIMYGNYSSKIVFILTLYEKNQIFTLISF